MREKVIDIYSPIEKKGDQKRRDCKGEKKKNKSGFLFLFFLVIPGYFYYVSFKTEVVVYPVTEETRLEESLLVRTVGSIGENEIRGILLSEKVSDKKKFEVEGRRMLEKKTEGEIKVCQDYRDSAVTFVEGTRFISDGGKIFFAISSFTLPARKVNNGCGVVTVVAAEAGEDYNIASDSKFALPGLHGSTIYGNVKGISFTIKEEGVLKEVPYLDDNTMQKAENEMKEDLFVKGRDAILERYSDDHFIENEAQYLLEVVERDLIEDDEDTFYFKLDVVVKVVAINKKDINNFISKFLPDFYTWRKETEDLRIDFTRINFEDEEANIVMSFTGDTYKEIDKEYFKREIRGLDFDEVERLMKRETEIEEVFIKNKPFGFKKVAQSFHRIDIKVQFDKN
jgi:hypothetical protein